MKGDATKKDDPAQSQRFIDMASEVDATDDGAAFEDAFAKVAKSTISPLPKKKTGKA